MYAIVEDIHHSMLSLEDYSTADPSKGLFCKTAPPRRLFSQATEDRANPLRAHRQLLTHGGAPTRLHMRIRAREAAGSHKRDRSDAEAPRSARLDTRWCRVSVPFSIRA